MLNFRYTLLITLFIFFSTNTFAAPPNIKAAEAKGLQRVNLEELKKFIPGSIKVKGHKGGKYKLTFKSDGSVDRTGGVNLDAQTGKWHFDEKNNAYCSAFEEVMGYQEVCFAVFRTPNGNKFVSYDIEDSFFAHGWRPLK